MHSFAQQQKPTQKDKSTGTVRFSQMFPGQSREESGSLKRRDKYEQEANRIADKVVRMPEPQLQRVYSCAGEGPIQSNRVHAHEARETAVPPVVRSVLSSSGQPLDMAARVLMESRFGHDFSRVRVHADTSANESAKMLGARAFTAGQDIVFGAGEYAPVTTEGKRLIAHELTHAIQQQSGAQSVPQIQKMSIGTGTPPERWVRQYNARLVPEEDRERVGSAIGMIRDVALNPDRYSSCHQFFHDNCPSGDSSSFRDTFDNALLWKGDREGALAFASAPGSDVAYTQSGYNSGARSLAVTLVHELLHNCGISGSDFHHLADVAGLYCIGNVNEFSISAGPAFNADVFYLLYSYRRLLAELGNGQIQLTAGADVNITGATALLTDEEAISEAGSLMVGLRGRTNLFFGGERFGGLTGRLEPGLGVGRFRVRDAESERSHPELGAGFVLQAGLGAEFYIPIGVNALPLSVEATYRLVVPLNQPAEAIHGILGNVGVRF